LVSRRYVISKIDLSGFFFIRGRHHRRNQDVKSQAKDSDENRPEDENRF
jgi:hypothetical protein